MANRPNLVGQRFGRLTVEALAGKVGAKRAWFCRCECGNSTKACTSDLRYGSVASCGCLLKGLTAANTKHGNSTRQGPTRTYSTWAGMLDRCRNPKNNHWKHYGGRGITVCRRWEQFENFLADMGPKPIGLSLDRINNDGNYEPGNCRWATAKEQRANRSDSRREAAVA